MVGKNCCQDKCEGLSYFLDIFINNRYYARRSIERRLKDESNGIEWQPKEDMEYGNAA